jgi:hypothetical protein
MLMMRAISVPLQRRHTAWSPSSQAAAVQRVACTRIERSHCRNMWIVAPKHMHLQCKCAVRQPGGTQRSPDRLDPFLHTLRSYERLKDIGFISCGLRIC